ncbi:hypothetical protein GCM10029963_65270 [Micromonospora andamanensis]
MTGSHRHDGHRQVLYIIACGSPLARDVGRLVDLAQQDGWDVCVITTPDGAKFVDRTALARQTGHPVRTHYKNPGDPDVLPTADAMIVCPATVNTVNKWVAGIADTLALGLLVEAQGRGYRWWPCRTRTRRWPPTRPSGPVWPGSPNGGGGALRR